MTALTFQNVNEQAKLVTKLEAIDKRKVSSNT